ncbi:MAG TPA: ABC transporter substrate-binding protein, partial [Candidatus Limnocylindrales bacterium]
MHRLSSPFTVVAVLLMLVLAACGTTADSPAPSSEASEGEDSPGPSAAASEGAEPSGGAASGDPIVVGSTLSLTGPLSATGVIHQIAGEQFVEQLNEQGGLLGRPVEWTVLDDESDQASVATLYERLISEEQVDLIIGPYATPLIISAMAVAERHGYVMPQHTAVLAPLMTYECQFPAWSIGPEPQVFVPEQVFDALESLDNPPSTIAFVTNQSGSTDFITHGQPDTDGPSAISIAEERGLEVVAD